MPKPGRPKQPPTALIRVPVNKLSVVEKLLGRSLADNQEPTVCVRVLSSDVRAIKKAIAK